MIKEAMLYKKQDGGRNVQCHLCAHRCKIAPSKYGVCGVRENRDGTLCTHVYGEAIASHIDPIEKKPLYHFFPGSTSYSIATAGCNFKCGFCQNWQISQASKGDGSTFSGYELKPAEVVREAKRSGSKSISYTYTEPTIFFEYAYETARIAKNEGIFNNFVTNGYMTKETLETINPYLDACNVDLKSFRDEFYRKECGARLDPVLDSIRFMKDLNIWVEVTTLIVPGVNDSDNELKNIAEFIADVDFDMPWHISRFHPDYKFRDYEPTPLKVLNKAKKAGKDAGLRYIYIGNVFGESSDTLCYNCGNMLIKRHGFSGEETGLDASKCSGCGTAIKGVFL